MTDTADRRNLMRIRDLRQAQNIPQGILAASMGVSQSVLCMWETETALPRTRDLPRLAKVLGCSIDDLFVSNPDAEAPLGA